MLLNVEQFFTTAAVMCLQEGASDQAPSARKLATGTIFRFETYHEQSITRTKHPGPALVAESTIERV